MNTLTDLRRTLDQHAADVADPTAVARTSAVHHRVAVVRRRRVVATGALAVAVVAVVATVVVPRGSHEAAPAAPIVLGQRAPATIGSLGYTYVTDGRSATFGREGSVKVSASTKPQLFSWTTDRDEPVRVVLPDGSVVHSSTTHFGDFVVLPPDGKGTLKVSVPEGRVGLASYALTSKAPPGYTKAGLTYRREVAGVPLVAAKIGDLGQTVLRTSFVARGAQVSISDMCVGVPEGDVVNVSINHHGRLGGSCDSAGTFDPAAGGNYATNVGRPGHHVNLRVWVSAGFHDPAPLPASSLPSIRLGVGVYGPLQQRRVGASGSTVPPVVEKWGHTWRLTSVRSSHGAPIRLPATSTDRVAAMAWKTHGHTRITFGTGPSRTPMGGSFDGGAAGLPDLWVPAGQPVQASLDHGRGTFGVALYERVD